MIAKLSEVSLNLLKPVSIIKKNRLLTTKSLLLVRTRDADFKRTIDANIRRIRNLEESRKDRLKLYGDFMPTLLDEINKAAQQNLFHYKPKGPIGELWAIYRTCRNVDHFCIPNSSVITDTCIYACIYVFNR